MARNGGIPAYGHHKGRGLAGRFVIDGKHIYLGPYDSEESKENMNRSCRKFVTDRTAAEMKARVEISTDLRIIELATAYLKFARGHHVKNGVPTPEYTHIYSALEPVKKNYPDDLGHHVRTAQAQGDPQKWVKAGLVRGQINKTGGDESANGRVGCGGRALRPATVLHALKAIKRAQEGTERGQGRQEGSPGARGRSLMRSGPTSPGRCGP